MRSLLGLMHDFNKKRAALEHMQKALPAIIGNECVKVIKNNFKEQQYETGSSWKPRTQATNTAYEYNRTASYRTPKLGKKSKYKNPYKGSVVHANRPILVQTGNLRDSVTFKTEGQKVFIGIMPNVKKTGALQEAHTYARINNEGGQGHWGKHSTKIPARQFMPRPSDGPSPEMIKRINKKIDSEIKSFMHDE